MFGRADPRHRSRARHKNGRYPALEELTRLQAAPETAPGAVAVGALWDGSQAVRAITQAAPDEILLAVAGVDSAALAAGNQSRRYQLLKRTLDVLCAGLLLLVLAPVLLVIAVAVALDSPGPVLFRQCRIGRAGRPFVMLKFRTMVPGLAGAAAPPAPGHPAHAGAHKYPRDPRVTRCGRILRRTCLDELPQLWNVFRGEMTLVGPRPELPEIVARYKPWQHLRHAVTPGMTGWWQVNRDGRRLMHEATELDLYYVAHQSLALDLLILWRTVGAVLGGTGAF